ncbi:MAG TPA: hypothetical protein IAC39_06865 [Candidatus Faeciplasma pullistercoris]|uniref:YolD-like protein n=1 Tax=Candidatus Faeciplasma pullistercoris TaxID=2840800 RepID=A0A9D1GW66_9FIRM|nr:hypothetical protein [Candidatus Faeciplasma pullistercoris]
MYEDIINLPHHVSKTRPQMSLIERAAQFSPFSALDGYDDAVDETARLTDRQAALSDDARTELDRKMQFLKDMISLHPEVTAVYFLPDLKKEGGAYLTAIGRVKKLDDFERAMVFDDGSVIPYDSILAISGEVFPEELG